MQTEQEAKANGIVCKSIKFLGIPDEANVGNLLFKSASFLASFPFLHSMAPAPLTIENFVKVIAITQGKLNGLLRTEYDVSKLLFLSFAVVENSRAPKESKPEVDLPGSDNEDEEDMIVFSLSDADTWDDLEVVQKLDKISTQCAHISGTDLHTLFAFLLAISSVVAPTPLAELTSTFEPKTYAKFKRGALDLIRAIDSTIATEADLKNKKLTYELFRPALLSVFPNILKPLGELYGLLLFSNTLGRQPQASEAAGKEIPGLFSSEQATKLVNSTTLAQMSALFGHSSIYGRLKKLYVGSDAGFSMRSFESKVFKWNAPTYLLVSGRLLNTTSTSKDKAFDEHFPPLRKPTYKTPGTTVTFGVYLTAPWKVSAKTPFGTADSTIFQLEPVQDKFVASSTLSNYAYFSRLQPGGIGAGSTPPQSNPHVKSKTSQSPYTLGNVSLTLDESLEYGVFRHLGLGGSYRPSQSRPNEEWEDRFQITEVEVWGAGKEEDLEEQKKRWEWEEREASYRARVNVQTLNEDRALLEMAGLVGNHGGGGSV